MKKTYDKGDLKVHWDSDVCIHSAECVKSLKSVFNPKAKPWINVDGGSIAEIKTAIDKCPSGALKYIDMASENATSKERIEIKMMKNGPALIKGDFDITLPDGSRVQRDGNVAICRCGQSQNKPLCDGSHKELTPPLDEA